MKNHRVVVPRRGAPDVMQVVEEPLPEPGDGEVRVRMEAAGVSAYDAMLRRSRFPTFPKVPFTPGVDLVGDIDELGEGVDAVEPEQRVAGWTFSRSGGCYSEFVCISADEMVPVPPGVDAAEAVCLVANYLTAYLAMHPTAAVRSGERILVHGGAGGIGSALLELGKLAGLEMYATASAHNHELVSDLGATPIDYRDEDFVERIRGLTGDGVDVVFDPVGGARQLWRSYQALRNGGRLIWIGVAATSRAGIKVIPLSLATFLALKLRPGGRRVISQPSEEDAWNRRTLTELLDLLAAGKIAPVVAERIPLTEAARAHELIEQGGVGGKVVLVPRDQP